MVSGGDKLIVVNNYDKIKLLVNFMTILSFVVLLIFIVGSFSHKMIGVEIIHSFQLIFLLQALSNNFTPVFGLLKYLSIVSCNFLFLLNTHINIYYPKYAILYNPLNQDFSQGLILGISIFLLLFIFPPLLWKWKKMFDDP
jgi:hypothetical protein